MKKLKYLIFILPLFLIFTSQVKAATAIPYGMSNSTSISSFKDGITLLPIKLYNDSYPNWNTTQYLEVYARPSETYNYIALEVCSYYDISYYVSNNNYTTAHFFNNNNMPYTPVQIGSCSITGVSGTYKKWRLYIQVANWGIPSGGADVYYTRGTIQFRNLGEHSQYVEIQNAYLTDSNEDMSMAETNEKLDNINDTQKETNEKLDDLNDNISNDDISGAEDSASDFFENFEDNDFGLSGIITAPLETIETITSNSCTTLTLPIPFVNKELNLPCMTTIYEEYFGSFLTIYQTITFGIIAYWVCVQIYAMVKGFKNPDKDEIEVLDL